MIERLPQFAELHVGTLCASGGVVCNKSDQDECGWDLFLQFPAKRTPRRPADMVSAGPEALVQVKSTRSPPLTARMGYWERAGLIEAVHHDGLELLTFVHKTFAEFAAARHVVGLGQAERARELARIIELPDWSEVTTFASGLGYGNDIARHFLARGMTGNAGQVQRALGVAIDPDAGTDDAVAQELVEMAFSAIAAGTPKKFAIGVSVMELAARRPAVVAPLAAERLRNADFATQLTAWAAIVAAGKDFYEPGSLEEALADLLPHIEPRYSKGGLFTLRASDDHDLIGPIGVAALEAQRPAAMEAFAERYLRLEAFQSTKIQARIGGILSDQGLSYSVLRDLHSGGRSLMDRFLNPPEEECQAHNKALRALAAAVERHHSFDPPPLFARTSTCAQSSRGADGGWRRMCRPGRA